MTKQIELPGIKQISLNSGKRVRFVVQMVNVLTTQISAVANVRLVILVMDLHAAMSTNVKMERRNVTSTPFVRTLSEVTPVPVHLASSIKLEKAEFKISYRRIFWSKISNFPTFQILKKFKF